MNLPFTFTSYQEIRDTRMSTPSESGSKPPFGEIVQPIGADAPEITARFKDPGGNVIGLYQQPA
jgi:hypothetical protein